MPSAGFRTSLRRSAAVDSGSDPRAGGGVVPYAGTDPPESATTVAFVRLCGGKAVEASLMRPLARTAHFRSRCRCGPCLDVPSVLPPRVPAGQAGRGIQQLLH